eukprot:TRINITY_DN67213_c9_g4_i1.p1 TRINITY_DN67213_c9_g4~~TRINITY_DN67213_c9_g4_i1.p1  ORF type:complete len:836 (+),score=137.53 TRINITY_DN67213_c9_g4_i1:35-2542(+)
MFRSEPTYVEALHSYSAAENNQISLAPKDRIEVLDKDASGWWIGRNAQGRVGIFPSTYVREIPRFNKPMEQKVILPSDSESKGSSSRTSSMTSTLTTDTKQSQREILANTLGLDVEEEEDDEEPEFAEKEIELNNLRGELEDLHNKMRIALRDREEANQRCQKLQALAIESREKKEAAELEMHVLRRTNIGLHEANRRLKLETEDLEAATQSDETAPIVRKYKWEPDQTINTFLNNYLSTISEGQDKLKKEVESLRQQLAEETAKSVELENKVPSPEKRAPEPEEEEDGESDDAEGEAGERDDGPPCEAQLKHEKLEAKYKKLEKLYKKLAKQKKERDAAAESSSEPPTPTTTTTPPPPPAVSAEMQQKSKEMSDKVEELRSQLQEREQLGAQEEEKGEQLGKEWEKKEKKYKKAIHQCKQRILEAREGIQGEQQAYEEKIAEQIAQKEELLAKKNDEKATLKKLKEQLKEIDAKTAKIEAEKNAQFQEILVQYKREEKTRRKLYNELQQLKGNTRFLCRVKPCDKDDPKVVVVDEDEPSITIKPETGKPTKIAEFDKCFGVTNSQDDMYQEVKPLSLSVLDGFNVCVLAYGETGSGKTYTMQGGSKNKRGLYFRCVEELFAIREERADQYKTSISLSALELYNEELFDLLNDRSKVEIQGMEKDSVAIGGLTIKETSAADQATALVSAACKLREDGKEALFLARSHCVVTIRTSTLNLTTGATVVGKINLIDLAGSEKFDGPKADFSSVTTSLGSLQKLLAKIQAKEKVLDFNACTLTRLLQDSLGGNCKCMVFTTIDPTTAHQAETRSTMQFVTLSKGVVAAKPAAKRGAKRK